MYITPAYDRIIHSHYNDIELVLGSIDDLRVWKAKDNSETPITKEELMAGDYQLMGIPIYKLKKELLINWLQSESL